MATQLNLTVRLYGVLRSRLRTETLHVSIPQEGLTVEELFGALAAEHPELGAWRGRTAVAIGSEIAGATRRVRPGDEVAFLPPVSGGRP